MFATTHYPRHFSVVVVVVGVVDRLVVVVVVVVVVVKHFLGQRPLALSLGSQLPPDGPQGTQRLPPEQ